MTISTVQLLSLIRYVIMLWLKPNAHVQRLVNVTPEIGYGDKGIGEIPPGATVSLSIELLNIKK